MKSRRPLVEGLKPSVDPKLEQKFVFQKPEAEVPVPPKPQQTRTSITTRIRSDFAAALKRASLERQLKGIEPNTLQEFLEEAIEPWLKQHGYLP